jgi:L-fuculose-phosphate aldolase
VLLANHGIICWADSVTHAEWYAEVLETYCWTLLIASQLGAPISYISEQKGADLLALKKKLGLPDVRFDASNTTEHPLSAPRATKLADVDLETLVQSITNAVLEALQKRGA